MSFFKVMKKNRIENFFHDKKLKEKLQKKEQKFEVTKRTKHNTIWKTKDQAMRTPLQTRGELYYICYCICLTSLYHCNSR